ncbi:MAG TPA: crosslink repair DNA glycosylase YcaQ family protein [Nocardioidaceae bacterium]|nr:crosslink repair DNA glycosylase YcaQ family protein [Nocardioidaceae bacterium]
MQSLSRAQARRITLAAQGFLDARHDPPTMRTLTRTVERTGVLQIDSVNVLQRAHYMPLYSRMGPYDVELLHRASGRAPRRLVEYWAHVAAYMPVDLWPAMQHRMRRFAQRGHEWGMRHNPTLASSLLDEVRADGAKTARDLDDGLPRKKDNWGWNWSDTKVALEYLFLAGELAVSHRNSQFERVYDLTERVLPATVLALPELTEADAHLELVRRAARSHGVATTKELADYYRMSVAPTQVAVDQLVAAGELEQVVVEGTKRAAYLHRDARVPRRAHARALLSPFDPIVWHRDRTEHLFDFFYRIEIYTPEAKRVHGYYVLPFLLGDHIVARVDLKADRAARALVVKGAYAEPAAPQETADELVTELRQLAVWLGLDDVVVDGKGDLAPALSAAVRRS